MPKEDLPDTYQSPAAGLNLELTGAAQDLGSAMSNLGGAELFRQILLEGSSGQSPQ